MPKSARPFSPSKLGRVFRCLASVHEMEQAPTTEPTAAQADGVFAHTLLETAIKNTYKPGVWYTQEGAPTLPDRTPPCDPPPSEEMVSAVCFGLQRIKDILSPFRRFMVWSEAPIAVPCPPTQWDNYEGGSKGGAASGVADILIVGYMGAHPLDLCAYVIDFKYGVIPVRAEKQLASLAAGAIDFVEGLVNSPLVTVITQVIQPRSLDPRYTLREQSLSRAQIDTHLDSIGQLARAYRDSPLSALYKPGSWCSRYDCSKKCSAYHTELRNDVAGILELNDGKRETTTEDIRYYVSRSAEIKKWLDNLKDYARDFMATEGPIPGLKLVPLAPRRQWNADMPPEKIAGLISSYTGAEEGRFYAKTLPTITAIKNLLKIKYGYGWEANQRIEAILDELAPKTEAAGYKVVKA